MAQPRRIRGDGSGNDAGEGGPGRVRHRRRGVLLARRGFRRDRRGPAAGQLGAGGPVGRPAQRGPGAEADPVCAEDDQGNAVGADRAQGRGRGVVRVAGAEFLGVDGEGADVFRGEGAGRGGG